MAYFNDPLLVRQIIMQHFETPDYKTPSCPSCCALSHRNKSATCIDDITVHMDVQNNIIQAVFFSGEGCTISTAATDLGAKLILNKDLDQALAIIDQYFHMIHHQDYDENTLAELNVFANIYKQPNRKSCAINGMESMRQILVGLKSGQQ